jgi:hypothetical protein
MSGKSLCRRTAAFVVLVLLFSSWAGAGERPQAPSRATAASATWGLLFERLWLSIRGFVTKEGCSLDPSGAHCASSRPVDEGCSLDPNGACIQTSATADEGCSLDPSGQCSK